MLDDFDKALEAINGQSTWKAALIDVCDSAYLCKKWLDVHAPGYTAADIIALTALVIAREQRATDIAEGWSDDTHDTPAEARRALSVCAE